MVVSAGQNLTAGLINGLVPNAYLHVYQSVVQALTTSTAAAITFTSEVVDTINGHSTGANTSRYTPTVPGKYRCLGMVAFAVNATGNRLAQFKKNGAFADSGPAVQHAAASGQGSFEVANATFDMNGSSDYIELFGWQSSGGSLNTLYGAPALGSTGSFMICEWVSP